MAQEDITTATGLQRGHIIRIRVGEKLRFLLLAERMSLNGSSVDDYPYFVLYRLTTTMNQPNHPSSLVCRTGKVINENLLCLIKLHGGLSEGVVGVC